MGLRAHTTRTAELYAPAILPTVRKITFADLSEALAKGWDDFMHKPGHVVTLALIYPIIGLILGRLAFEASDGIPDGRTAMMLQLIKALEAQGISFHGDPMTSPGVRLCRTARSAKPEE